MADLTGQQFGNYRLVRLLGRGGFADVYLGQHVHLTSQRAALKILSAQLDGQDTQLFVREAETIAALVHPHIIRILDFAIQERSPFLVMDYAPYGSLRQRHERGEQVPLPIVVSYTQQIAQGLTYAHEKKIVHRDIKPDNMLIDGQNKIIVSDFGIATIAANTTSHVTQGIGGTASYMAPEQSQGQARPASDQYALAICVYEWLTGTCPFTGTFTEVALKHALAPPASLREKCPTLPPQVEQVVLKALAKDPKDRFINILAFANALTQASQLAFSEHTAPAFSEQTVPAFYATSPVPAYQYPSVATNVTTHSSSQPYLQTAQGLQIAQEQAIHADKRKKIPVGLFVVGLVLLVMLAVGSASILPLIKNSYAQPSTTPIVATIPTPTPLPTPTPAPTATPLPTPTPVPIIVPVPTTAPVINVSSVADFTVQPPQLSNTTLLRNDAVFQGNHSVLNSAGQVIMGFTSQQKAKTVTVVIRGLVSQSSPNQSGFSPINVLCNGQVILANYTMPGGGFAPNTTSIKVPIQDITPGANQLELQVANNASTLFWLYRLEVQQVA